MEYDNIMNKLSIVDSYEDFLENSLNGFITATPQGVIIQCNPRVCQWLGSEPEQVIGKRFPDLLNIGGKIFYETHLSPLLRMQGFFEEVVLELVNAEGQRIEILVNGYERRNENGDPLFIRLTIFKARDRIKYEQNLRAARIKAENTLQNELELSRLREQFIAVLGHDLRNPLGSVIAGAGLLTQSALNENDLMIVNIIKRSAGRMAELIKNVMDFTRARLGGGINLDRQPVRIEQEIYHVIDEIRAIWPERIIMADINVPVPVNCDAPRIAQMFSNLLGNAVTHGSSASPVQVTASIKDNSFQLSISNSGDPIPPEHIERLFQPFTREENSAGQHGLGLGLFIASSIAEAHEGKLSLVSDADRTVFTFEMKVG